MTQFKQIYKCPVCGNIVEILDAGNGQLICCGQPMQLMEAHTQDTGAEKHVPVVEDLPATACQDKDGVKIKIGAVEHPMTPEHHIEWIEINTGDGKAGKKFLNPGDKPELIFTLASTFWAPAPIAMSTAYGK